MKIGVSVALRQQVSLYYTTKSQIVCLLRRFSCSSFEVELGQAGLLNRKHCEDSDSTGFAHLVTMSFWYLVDQTVGAQQAEFSPQRSRTPPCFHGVLGRLRIESLLQIPVAEPLDDKLAVVHRCQQLIILGLGLSAPPRPAGADRRLQLSAFAKPIGLAVPLLWVDTRESAWL